jgi:hypothetical protein
VVVDDDEDFRLVEQDDDNRLIKASDVDDDMVNVRFSGRFLSI